MAGFSVIFYYSYQIFQRTKVKLPLYFFSICHEKKVLVFFGREKEIVCYSKLPGYTILIIAFWGDKSVGYSKPYK